MEIDQGKLFVGGVSWDTNEDRLRDYFQNFGDVVEAVIMRDRTTGRARGFGFVVFADPAVAERVVQEKHIIDGRSVEAKKAVPRDDQNNISRNPRGNNMSPGRNNIRTKKIFVGGLPSTVTDSDFKKYFDQFGLITDVVVMYDHNTQRPRGFGFITFDTEDAVDRALYKTFHELNGKMVEVKRAVPKEMSPGPNRSPLGSYSPGLSRVSSFLSGYPQGGYASSPVGNYGARVDGRVSPGSIPPFVSLYERGMHGEPILNSSCGLSSNFNPNLGSVNESTPLYGGISGRPASNGPVGHFRGNPLLRLWGSDSFGFSANSGTLNGSGNGNSWMGPYESIGNLWGSSSCLSDGFVNGSSKLRGGNANSGSIHGRYPGSCQKNNVGIGVIGPPSSYAASGVGYGGSLDPYENDLACGDHTGWGISPSKMEDSAALSYGRGNVNTDAIAKSNAGGYGMSTTIK